MPTHADLSISHVAAPVKLLQPMEILCSPAIDTISGGIWPAQQLQVLIDIHSLMRVVSCAYEQH